MPHRRPWRLTLALWLASGTLLGLLPAHAAPKPAAAATPAQAASSAESAPAAVANSALDDRLLYQLLIGEMALNQGDAGTAYDWILDAARRTRDERLFRRAVDIAMQARAGEQALAATRAWRLARPESLDALRLQLQIVMLLNRSDAVPDLLKSLLQQTPASERAGLIAALPRFLQRAGEPPLVASLMEDALKPYRDDASTRVASRVALGRAWMQARNPDRALALAQEAQALEPAAPGPALLAMELMRERPTAEAVVQEHLRQPGAEPALRLTFVRVLTTLQRYADATAQLVTATRLQPEVAGPYLSLGALYLELKQPKEGEAALLRYLDLQQRQPAANPPVATASRTATDGGNASETSDADNGDSTDDEGDTAARGQVQAWLMLAQSTEQRGDFKAAESWLAKITDPQRALEVQSRRASILAKQGKVAQARELIRQVPERSPQDARAKIAAEAAVLRDVKRWRDAYEVLDAGTKSFSEDADLIYEQAMMAEKLDKLADMERLLRRVIELKPDNAHAHNALGYSLADRQQRLPEAKQLVARALELSPGDPFITDSLGWVEFRLGNHEEAARLLRQAYASRPDVEIGAHLGEVLWALGQRDDARRIWREAKGRDAANDVLRETLSRLRVDP
jgi:tetratricopeptide (TPR) repeat protein